MIFTDSLFIMAHCLSVISLEGIKLELNHLNSFWGQTGFLLRLIGSISIFIAILTDILELFNISINISQDIYYTIPDYELEKLKSKNFKEVLKNKKTGKEIPSKELQSKVNINDSVFENIKEEE